MKIAEKDLEVASVPSSADNFRKSRPAWNIASPILEKVSKIDWGGGKVAGRVGRLQKMTNGWLEKAGGVVQNGANIPLRDMNAAAMRRLIFGAVVIMACAFGCRMPQTDKSSFANPPAPSIKTTFIDGTNLSPSELDQVIALARRSGVRDVAQVETFYYLPTIEKGISVKSREKLDGRNHSYDKITIGRSGWLSQSAPKDSLQLGDFWVERSGRKHVLLREYEFKGKTVKIDVSGVNITVADRIISSVFTKRVQGDLDFDRLFELEPETLCANEKGGYSFFFKISSSGWQILSIEIRDGEIFVTGISEAIV
jgi:hypothetical protein